MIAEGVETKKQKEILLTMACKLAQGYLFSRPQPVESVEEILD